MSKMSKRHCLIEARPVTATWTVERELGSVVNDEAIDRIPMRMLSCRPVNDKLTKPDPPRGRLFAHDALKRCSRSRHC